MRNRWLLPLGFALASAPFGGCGGVTESDRGHAGGDSGVAGDTADVASEMGPQDAADVADVASDLDAQDAAGDGDAGAEPQTCAACGVTAYSCNQGPLGLVTYVPDNVQPDGCLLDRVLEGPNLDLHCEPLEICDMEKCYAVTQEDNGVIRWKNSDVEVVCYPYYW